jgi:hypothetical protein
MTNRVNAVFIYIELLKLRHSTVIYVYVSMHFLFSAVRRRFRIHTLLGGAGTVMRASSSVARLWDTINYLLGARDL